MNALNPVLMPAIGAILILALDLLGRSDRGGARQRALAGIRLGAVAVLSLMGVAFTLAWGRPFPTGGVLDVDGFGLFGIGFIVVAGALVLALSLTHFGMARSRPAEPIALLLFFAAHLLTIILSLALIIAASSCVCSRAEQRSANGRLRPLHILPARLRSEKRRWNWQPQRKSSSYQATTVWPANSTT